MEDVPPPEPPHEQELVTRRPEYLQAMLDSSYRKTELTDVLDAPRSTVDRAVRELEDAGLVERSNSEFTTTLTGEFAFNRYMEYTRFSQSLFEAKEILNTADVDSDDIPPELLYDASVSQPEAHMPDQAVQGVKNLVMGSEYLHGLAPVALSAFTTWIQEMLAQGDHSFEIVASEKVLETLQTAMKGDFQALQQHSDDFELLVTDDDMPYALWFASPNGVEHVGLTVYDDTGAIGTIVSGNEVAVEWGRDQYDGFKEGAERIL